MATACSKCGQPSVLHVTYSGQHLCREHFLRSFEKRAMQEVSKQGKLPAGILAVALSGGKDSVSLLHFLHGLVAERPQTQLVAITVDEGIAGYRDGSIAICRELTNRLGVPWHLVKTKDLAGYDIDTYARGEGKNPTSTDRPACGPCGVFRRAGLNNMAKDLGAAAVATGHNLDDMAQTIMMNVLGGDPSRLARLAPHDHPREGLIRRMLPFRTIPEKEVLLYALLNDLPLHHEEECPYAARAHRWRIRDMLWKLEEDQPGTRHRLLAFQDQIKPLLAADQAAATMKACAVCREPTSGTTCKTCEWKS